MEKDKQVIITGDKVEETKWEDNPKNKRFLLSLYRAEIKRLETKIAEVEVKIAGLDGGE